MEHYILETHCGNTFSLVAAEAKDIATEISNKVDWVSIIADTNIFPIVEFDFNGIKCLVDKNTNLDYLYRDYCNSWLLKWKTVGPKCVEKYSNIILLKFKLYNIINKLKSYPSNLKYNIKEKYELYKFKYKTHNIIIDISNEDNWKTYKESNTDPYGKCVIDYAESWAKLMQRELSKGKTLEDCAEKTSYELGFYGITGYMYGAAVGTLVNCWKYGEELRIWHNNQYNHSGDGVVNPAVLSVDV